VAALIVADANALIAHLDRADVHHERAVALLLDGADLPLGASLLTVAEVLVGPARAGRLADARAALETLGLCGLPFGADAADRLARLRAETQLRLPDCGVLLAAQENGAQAIVTFDARLAATAGRLGISVR